MGRTWLVRTIWVFSICLLGGATASALAAPVEARQSAQATNCPTCRTTRNLYFGDLHMHTAYSFDAYGFGTRTDPAGAYALARETLDFAAVTEHAEFLGETELCITPGSPGYDTPECQILRAGGADTMDNDLRQLCEADPPHIEPALCAEAASQVWARIVSATEAAYAPGEFTTFIGYEISLERENDSKIHRNVIFAGSVVSPPISRFNRDTPLGLWESLSATCLPAEGCDVVTIPHTTNASRGLFFALTDNGGGFIPVEQASLREQMEPIVEIYQSKGNAECYPGVGNNDEQCEFEKLPLSRVATEPGGATVPKLSWVREGLKTGLLYEDRFGVDPFRFGFIGGSDTHNGTGGKTDEATFTGHAGSLDDTAEERLGTETFAAYSPGGLAAVWAPQNTRDALFAALRRREVYATSGTRILARFFGGWTYASDLCNDPQMTGIAYRDGVPMGSVLSGAAGPQPIFLVSAQQDPHSAGLKKLQIVKGWTANNAPFEKIYTVAESAQAWGAHTLCAVWADPEFVPTHRAFYYARVIETTTPRWSAYDCEASEVDCGGAIIPPDLVGCCDGTVPMTLEERAWTSPIWYEP